MTGSVAGLFLAPEGQKVDGVFGGLVAIEGDVAGTAERDDELAERRVSGGAADLWRRLEARQMTGDGVRRGRIRCSVRIWTRPHVKVGGRYRMDDGHIVVDSIEPITRRDITADLARESGFSSVDDLLEIARHGRGRNTYLIRFHYLPPGAWDRRPAAARARG